MKININPVLAPCTMRYFRSFLQENIGIGIYFVSSRWYLKKDIPRVKFNTNAQTTI